MASVQLNGQHAKLWAFVFIAVQIFIGLAGFLMAHTLTRVEGTLTAIDSRLLNHESRISRIEGRNEK